MKYTYGKEDLKNYLMDGGLDVLLDEQKFQALIVERKIAEDSGNYYIDAVGHDDVCLKGIRYETKYTNYILGKSQLRINSAGENKRNGFDILRIVDGVNKRIFEIPHDVYFRTARFYGNEFRWSVSYNEKDKVQMDNTKMVLAYEITTKD